MISLFCVTHKPGYVCPHCCFHGCGTHCSCPLDAANQSGELLVLPSHFKFVGLHNLGAGHRIRSNPASSLFLFSQYLENLITLYVCSANLRLTFETMLFPLPPGTRCTTPLKSVSPPLRLARQQKKESRVSSAASPRCDWTRTTCRIIRSVPRRKSSSGGAQKRFPPDGQLSL
jgi:hypothetical protein